MKAVVTTGNGGYEKLVYCDAPMPVVETGEVLLQVLAAGINNTEINTRLVGIKMAGGISQPRFHLFRAPIVVGGSRAQRQMLIRN